MACHRRRNAGQQRLHLGAGQRVVIDTYILQITVELTPTASGGAEEKRVCGSWLHHARVTGRANAGLVGVAIHVHHPQAGQAVADGGDVMPLPIINRYATSDVARPICPTHGEAAHGIDVQQTYLEARPFAVLHDERVPTTHPLRDFDPEGDGHLARQHIIKGRLVPGIARCRVGDLH